MTKWEYRILTFSSWTGQLKEDQVAEIVGLGEEGWELAGMSSISTKMTMVFKRPLPTSSRREKPGWPDW